MTKRVAVYARVSTTRQAENDISIPDQFAHAKRFCAAKGWSLFSEFVDAGASARDDKRPQFQRMMEAVCVDPSPIDVVFVHSQSRFFRDVAGYSFWKRKLEKYGVSVVSMTQDFGEGSSANFAETVLAARINTAAKKPRSTSRGPCWKTPGRDFGTARKRPSAIARSRPRSAASGSRSVWRSRKARPPPCGRYSICFSRATAPRGRWAIKDIASWLNRNGFRNRNGNPYYVSIVHAILTRDAYSGVYYYNTHDSRTRRARPKDEWIAVEVPQIIPAKDFKRVQALLHSRRPAMTPPRTSNSAVLLSGLARCDSCGSPMMLRTGKGEGGTYRYYACSANRLKGASTCKRPIAVARTNWTRSF